MLNLPLHGEVPYIEAFMNESERKLTGNHYKWIFNPDTNIDVICNDELRCNKLTEVGDHPLFGECFINREQTVMYRPCPDCLEGKPSRHKGMHHSWGKPPILVNYCMWTSGLL